MENKHGEKSFHFPSVWLGIVLTVCVHKIGIYGENFTHNPFFLWSAHAVGEFEDILSGQANLVQKLRDECRHLASKLEQFQTKYKWEQHQSFTSCSDSFLRFSGLSVAPRVSLDFVPNFLRKMISLMIFYRNENRQLKNSVEQLKVRLNKYQKRAGELEDGNKSHAQLHDKMRQRLRLMDEHAQHQAQQVSGPCGARKKSYDWRLTRKCYFIAQVKCGWQCTKESALARLLMWPKACRQLKQTSKRRNVPDIVGVASSISFHLFFWNKFMIEKKVSKCNWSGHLPQLCLTSLHLFLFIWCRPDLGT